jgi:hypothetical protein
MQFKKQGYTVIKKIISKESLEIIFNYFLLKRTVCKTLLESNHIPYFNEHFGKWNDAQVPGTYSIYGDPLFDTLLYMLLPSMEKITKKKLILNYSYGRIYKKGDILEKHKDRASCEISTTLNIGGEKWPIYVQLKNKKNIKVILNPGDMLVYRGCDLLHWREPFDGVDCAQVFLHYTDASKKENIKNEFDGRPHLGLPFDCKK